MNPRDVTVVFMGSPAFAVPSFSALLEAGYRVAAAVTQPDRPAGRGSRIRPSDVKLAALERDVLVLQPETLRDPAAVAGLANLHADVFVVAAYGKILPRSVLALPARGCVNAHASLLPRWRGPSPINAAILAGDPATGVTIMEMSAKMDAGPIISQVQYSLGPRATAGRAERDLSLLGAKALVDTLPEWYDRKLEARDQDESHATYCPLLTKGDGHLRATMTVVEAERAVRAYDPWPGASVEYRGARLGIWQARVQPSDGHDNPGAVRLAGREPAVAFAGGLLVLEEVQRTGSKRMKGTAFVNGERGDLAPSVVLA